jgi:metal-sulfur cluster biosynthetic enzyme
MRGNVTCEFPFGYDGTTVLDRLAQVLDPELAEPILDLGFVRSFELSSGHASVELRLPTSWCAVNFAYLMAEDVRRALLTVEQIDWVTVSLGDHCAAAEIEAAVNDGLSFAEAFPGEAPGTLEALRRTFLRNGFLARQERLLKVLREAGCSPAMICPLRLGEVSTQDDAIMIRQPGSKPATRSFLAAWAPVPLTGQSSRILPWAASRASPRAFTSIGKVLHSITIWPLPLLEAMPPWPAITCSKASTLGREVIRISACSAASRGEAAAIPPASASRAIAPSAMS